MDNQKTLSELEKLSTKLQGKQLPANLLAKIGEYIERAKMAVQYGNSFSQIDLTSKYIDFIVSLPWNTSSPDQLDIQKAKQILDANHFGLEKIKSRILEYLSVLILQKQQKDAAGLHAPSLFFVGFAGTGKTTLAHSVAQALGRQFIRIPFGGLSSALDLRGQSNTTPEAQPGMIMKALVKAGTNNPVILLDELDRITPESKAAIMGVLIELLDPEQHQNFSDYFVDYPFDLSQVLFIATANNTNTISTAVMDRLEVIQMPSYTDEEKIVIAKNYILPRYIKEVGMRPDTVQIADGVWAKITRPLGFDAGIRTLERTIETIVRKAAFKMVSGGGTVFVVDENNIRDFLT